eukprot:1019602_1
MSVQVAVKPQGLPSEDSPCSKSSDASSQTRGVSAAQVPIAPPTPRINVERVTSDTAALLAYHSPGISEAEARELSAHLWMDTHHSLPTRGRALTTPAISPLHDEARTEAGVVWAVCALLSLSSKRKAVQIISPGNPPDLVRVSER